ncbi:MAG: hypothetical protein KatS3mg008_0858 [Acidimicrobiales bacterium]|nr:MAG: hypothetical protein KatS3mg008_0858 [Acidimicrobiales bacterium]
MGDEFVPVMTTATSGEFDRYRPKSSLPFVLAGVALVALVGAGAVLFGVVDVGSDVEQLRYKVPIVGARREDGWLVMEDPGSLFRAEVPSDPKDKSVKDPGVGIGSTERAWEWSIADETILRLGVVESVDGLGGGKSRERLADVAAAVAGSVGVDASDAETRSTAVAGRPGLTLTVDNVAVAERRRGTLLVTVVAASDDVVYVATRSVYEDPSQHDRVLSNLQLDFERERARTDSGA